MFLTSCREELFPCVSAEGCCVSEILERSVVSMCLCREVLCYRSEVFGCVCAEGVAADR